MYSDLRFRMDIQITVRLGENLCGPPNLYILKGGSCHVVSTVVRICCNLKYNYGISENWANVPSELGNVPSESNYCLCGHVCGFREWIG